MSAWAANATVAAGILLTGVSFILAVVGWASYRRIRQSRLAWVTLAFFLFTAQGLFLAMTAYRSRGEIVGLADPLPGLIMINLAIVGALYVAVVR